jgi:hypothetical protein
MSGTILQPRTKTAGSLQAESPLSPHRAFVVQFRAETKVARGRYAGRVEHVISGQATHFASLEELLAFVGRVLATVRAPPRKRPRRGAVSHYGGQA